MMEGGIEGGREGGLFTFPVHWSNTIWRGQGGIEGGRVGGREGGIEEGSRRDRGREGWLTGNGCVSQLVGEWGGGSVCE